MARKYDGPYMRSDVGPEAVEAGHAEALAVDEFLVRQSRRRHPDGTFDSAQRWYPSAGERCGCCEGIRSPSRAHPYSYMVHCRTAAHVAQLYGIPVEIIRYVVREMRGPRATTPETRYKIVARVADKLVSLHDGATEYVIGREMYQPARSDHGGGYYSSASPDEARSHGDQVQAHESVAAAERVLIECQVRGGRRRYEDKLATSRLLPVAIVV